MQVRIRKASIPKLRKIMAVEDRSGSHVVARLIAKAPEPKKK